MVEVSRAITKHHYLVQHAREIARIVKEAFHLASTGRPGPVLIDIPKDVQNTLVPNPDYEVAMDLPGYRLPPPPTPGEGPRGPRRDPGERTADHLLRRRRGRLGRGRGTARVRRQDGNPRGHDRARPGVHPQRPLSLAQDARDARHGLRQLRHERGRPAAGLRRPVRRPGHRQAQRVRQARPDRPRQHRRLRDQQEQVRARPGPHRRPGVPEGDQPAGRAGRLAAIGISRSTSGGPATR